MRLKLTKKKAEVEVSAPTTSPLVVVVQRPVFKRRLSERVLGGAVVVLLPGFLLASSIPALAAGVTPFGDDTELNLAAPVESKVAGQELAVTAEDAAVVSRGTFSAETHAQLAARKAAANARRMGTAEW